MYTLLDTIVDQMKEENPDFRKFLAIASHPEQSKKLFRNFVKNDPDFYQTVDRENFRKSLRNNEDFKAYIDTYPEDDVNCFYAALNLLFDLLETPSHDFPYVLFFEMIYLQQEDFGIESELTYFDWQHYFKECAVLCIKEEAKNRGIVYENI